MLGLAITRIRLPPLVGYLLAGIVVGPFTPGYVADSGLAHQLAEIGIILLMFGVVIHFSVGDLFSVRRMEVPDAAVWITLATALGAAVPAWWWTAPFSVTKPGQPGCSIRRTSGKHAGERERAPGEVAFDGTFA